MSTIEQASLTEFFLQTLSLSIWDLYIDLPIEPVT